VLLHVYVRPLSVKRGPYLSSDEKLTLILTPIRFLQIRAIFTRKGLTHVFNSVKQQNAMCIVKFRCPSIIVGVSTTSRRKCGFLPELERLQDWVRQSHGRVLAWSAQHIYQSHAIIIFIIIIIFKPSVHIMPREIKKIEK